MKKSSVSRTQKITYSQILCYALENEREPTIKCCLGGQVDVVQRVHHNTELWTQLMVSEWNSSGISSQDSPHSFATNSTGSKLSDKPKTFTGRIIFISILSDILWGSQDNEQDCELRAKLVFIHARRFSPRTWSFLGTGPEKSGILLMRVAKFKENGTVAELIMIKFSES